MELVERDGFIAILQTQFSATAKAEGHCVFVSGEAGIGKTSLVRAFCKEVQNKCTIYRGTCDALFTPRPLAPLYDILLQIHNGLPANNIDITDRTAFFLAFFHELAIQNKPILIVFEDIHWADEATLDFIKFLARRIVLLRCLFILTYRDDEIHAGHGLRNILGQLSPDSFTRMRLTPLSRQAVEKMAEVKGYSGEDVYSISGGNPFYVNEILSSYSLGVPDNIRDSIISAYNRTEERTRQVWELLSVIPSSFEIRYLEKFEPLYATAIENCLNLEILIINDGLIHFKHELFRRTIESSLSPLKRVSLNKKILDLLKGSFEQNQEIERIVHHAKNANDYETVVDYAPVAARQAASLGAHIEASKLYLTAIENYQKKDRDILIRFYESYAYECYLTNQVKEAIIYTSKSMNIRKDDNEAGKFGNCLRFLSRLWWLDGNRKKAESFAGQAVELLDKQASSPAKAMAFSNMAQLKMLLDQPAECIFWGKKAIAIAGEIHDEETLSHALNNVGSVQMNIKSSEQIGTDLLMQSLQIALKNSYHEHAARAYSNLASNAMAIKNFVFAEKMLDEGIQYCEERDLDSWRFNMLSVKARLNVESGNWKQAFSIAETLLRNDSQLPSFTITALMVLATIKMRRGDADSLPLLLKAEKMAFETRELQRIIPVLIGLLEYEWLTGKSLLKTEDLDRITSKLQQSIYSIQNSEFGFWLLKVRKQDIPLTEVYEGFETGSVKKAQKAAALWATLGCPYLRALCLYDGTDDDKKVAITIIYELGASNVYEKMKLEMRTSGIKSIPGGRRKSTQANPALLTDRELDVLRLLNEGMQNKEIAAQLYISVKTVDHHMSAIMFKLDVNSRLKAVQEAIRLEIIK